MNKEKAKQIYHDVYLVRRCEEKIRDEYASDAMKTPVHLHVGAEAICAGVLAALPKGLKVFGTYRNHGLYLPLTQDPKSFFAELYGKATGCAQGKAGSMHLTAPEHGLFLTSAVVATTIPVAVGAALAHQYRKEKNVVAVFFGDGAVEEGAFWESLNFACLKQLRVFFVCEDNDLAIHTPTAHRQGFKSIPEAAAGFRCHMATADGWDPETVYAAASGLLQRMEAEPKPCLLHFKYFRYLEHVGVGEDFKFGYRPKPDEPALQKYDPLKAAERMAANHGLSDSDIQKINQEVDALIEESVAKAKTDPFPDEQEFGRGVMS
ncbi:MAG TPA: thiamine pyrophosphate-dependent dehydrogenase E1 component subunit alpha [Verrucomicrobiae bacterium]|jgi:TPP-dependent pyruvate/acetoin dehydrogenase alpha subunit|nr:thiamine pyrophosphate-dependent dehydrogenase E1 component subunit alpha [Verrucomicrobiae bacterium]